MKGASAEEIAALEAIPAPEIPVPPRPRGAKRGKWGGTYGRCGVCELGKPIVNEIEAHIANPDNWPKDLRAASGRFPAEVEINKKVYAIKAWLDAHNFETTTTYQCRKHMVHRERERKDAVTITPPSGAVALTSFYGGAIEAGLRALRILQTRMQKDRGADMSNAELMQIAKIGGQYAASAAALRQRPGASPLPNDAGFVPEDKDEKGIVVFDGFMGGRRAPRKVGHVSVRTIDGESRTVYDEGAADRAAAGERAFQMGDERGR